ncbi:17585_t:CDS:2, partial [Acaulospora colombiana]
RPPNCHIVIKENLIEKKANLDSTTTPITTVRAPSLLDPTNLNVGVSATPARSSPSSSALLGVRVESLVLHYSYSLALDYPIFYNIIDRRRHSQIHNTRLHPHLCSTAKEVSSQILALRSHPPAPLTSSVSLPDTILASNIQRYPSPTQSTNSRHSAGQNHNANSTPLRVVAPFVYNAPPAAYESTSSLASDEIRDSEKSSSLRIKRSITKLLSSKEEAPSNPYPKSTPRDSGKKKGKENGDAQRPRKGSFFGSSSSFFEEPTTKSSSRPPSIASTSSGAKKLVNWIGQSGVTRKFQDVLSRSGSSSHPSVSSSAKARKSGEYGDEERDDASSISSTTSFVQNAPEDDFTRIFPEPEPVPAMPLPNLQPPYQIPTAVYLPRSHTNLHALTLASLAFPPSPHPLLYNPSMPAFPRSSNPSSKLPRLPTFRAHLAKTRILDRLEAQDLTPSENESIIPFGRRDDPSQKEPNTSNSTSEGEGEEGKRTINDNPGSSVGLEAWTRRLPFSERIRVWKNDTSYNGFGNSGDDLKYEPLTPSRPFRTELQISGGIKALAGLVAARPLSIDRELPQLPPPEPVVLPEAPPTLTLGPISPLSQEALVIEESMLMESNQTPPPFTPNTVIVPLPAVPVALTSPRPLPVPPSRAGVESVAQQKDWEDDEDNFSLVIPVRPLPPRPLPIPPSASSSQASLDQILVVDTPAFTAPTQNTVHLSSSGHDHSQSGLLSSSSMTSAPQTPMDLLETESIRRRSIGSISVVISNPGTVSLEEMDGLEATNPMDIDTRRRSTATLRMSIAQKRMSMASRKSHVSPMSSPSLRNHPLPPLTESFYSHSRVSSQRTPMDSAGGSMEKLSHQKGTSTSSTSFEPPLESLDQHNSRSSSPAIIESVNAMINEPKAEDQKSLEPSRISEEHVDPFFYPANAPEPPQQKLVINGTSSPILSPAETERLFSSSSEMPMLTLS